MDGIAVKPPVRTGLDRLLASSFDIDAPQQTYAFLCNASSVTSKMAHGAYVLLQRLGPRLKCLFAPEHGLTATLQYMQPEAHRLATDDQTDDLYFPDIYSLYGSSEEGLKPQGAWLEGIDVLLCDLQDVGTRYYTFQATMALCMQACAQQQKQHKKIAFWVLDRPNPLGGLAIEGGGRTDFLKNFCGLYNIPHRHGMTIGELAKLYNTFFGIGCDLKIIPMEHWQRSMYYEETGLQWVLPSPQMPTIDTAMVYTGMCLLETCNLSEGRGTNKPFEIFGAPYIESALLKNELLKYQLPGVFFRELQFQPTFDKYQGVLCHGLQLHVFDREKFLSYRTGLAVLHAAKKLYPNHFKWRQDTYEFRSDVPAIDLLCGNDHVRTLLEAGAPFDKIAEASLRGLPEGFQKAREDALLY